MGFSTQRSKVPMTVWQYWRTSMPKNMMPIEEFKQRLHALTSESTNDDVDMFNYDCGQRKLGPFYLGSRDEVDYAIWCPGQHDLVNLSFEGPDVYAVCLPDGDLDTIKWGEDQKNIYYIDEDASRAVTPGTWEEKDDVSLQTGQKPQKVNNAEGRVWKLRLDLPLSTGERSKADIERLLPLGTLLTWTDKDKWSQTRFTIGKSLNDNGLWIVGEALFLQDMSYSWVDKEGLTWSEQYEPLYALNHERAFALDGFEEKIACARLRANDQDFKECELFYEGEGAQLIRPKPADRKLFDLEQVYQGTFFTGYFSKRK
ncbi:MAG: hypothetical protein M1821_004816 [Bathelium mastoideum]|nr:MAG: hypothetical protein M1821_004816 [Bathelium mastoideum]KAI9692227.1 MAG: hypothetical protein M1822_006457 [Bathelium mastoideum]